MPGASVVASSPALIEKSRTVATDGAGRYSIIDLRPGTYAITVTAPGFKTFRKEGIDVAADTSVPIYIDLSIGTVGETVTVQSESQTVDVESAATMRVLTREVMDTVPNARNMQQLGGLVAGIRLTTPDVGGSQQMEQTYFTGHGAPIQHTTVLLDGMNINSNYIDGQIQNYVDNAIIQQSTYQTSGISAEVSAGGLLVNQIPKDGGNTFHSDVFLGLSGGSNFWQASNVTKDLVNRGLTGQSKVKHIEDFDGSVGGPVIKDKLWFLSAFRYQSTYGIIPGSFYPDGSPGIEDQYIKSGSLRLSWQITAKDKFSGTYERFQKFKGHELFRGGVVGRPDNPAVSAQRRGPPLYYVAQGKWTRVQSSRMLFEGGFSTDVIHYSDIYQQGEEQIPFSPEWYAKTTHLDLVTNVRSNAPQIQNYFLPDRRVLSGAVSYITGSHNIKAGVQDAWGKNDRVSSINGDLQQQYQNGVPVSVLVYNTPVAVRQRVNADLGLYGQDTWHIKRFSLTAGLRWEYQKSTIDPSQVGKGRFIEARSFPKINCETIPGLGCWKTWAPRLGLVYDLFGNGKTALKASFGKYNTPVATTYLTSVNPMAVSTDTRSWTDKDISGRILPTNGDGIAQDNEIGPSTNANFGKLASVPKFNPSFAREYNLQYSAGVQHQITNNMKLNFNWFRRTNYDGTYIRNRAVDPVADWTPFSFVNPLSGEQITAYNLKPEKFGLPADLFQTNGDQSLRRNTYTGYEFGLVARLPRGGHIFAGWTIDHITDIACDASANTTFDGNNLTNGALNDPNSLRFCNEAGRIPFRHEFKAAGNIRLLWKIEFNWVWQDAPEPLKYVTWNLTRTSRYPADCSVPGCTPGGLVFPSATFLTNPSLSVPLVAPGTRFMDRLHQVDLGIRRTFVIRERFRVQAQADMFNVNNSNAVLLETQTLGNSVAPFVPGGLGGTPQSLLQPRLLRLALQVHF
jgi:Carboxypeptidase regulatory-like domain/TonB-dependent Receptor Plug Domain